MDQMMTPRNSDAHAIDSHVRDLNTATRDGDQRRALEVLTALSVPVASTVLLEAGYRLGYRSISEFWSDAQRDIAQACANNTDGYGIRRNA
jgi:hypothetical protein